MSHLVVSNTQRMSTKKKGTSRRLRYDKKVKSLKVNFLWQVHNLKYKESLVQAWWCCAEVVFLEAEVRGSVSYTVNGFQSVQHSNSWRWRRRFQFAVLQCSSRAQRMFLWSNFRWKLSLIVIPFLFLFLLFRWVGGCDIVFVTLHVSSPQSLWRCISIDFYAMLL